jgi:hypothetical protein
MKQPPRSARPSGLGPPRRGSDVPSRTKSDRRDHPRRGAGVSPSRNSRGPAVSRGLIYAVPAQGRSWRSSHRRARARARRLGDGPPFRSAVLVRQDHLADVRRDPPAHYVESGTRRRRVLPATAVQRRRTHCRDRSHWRAPSHRASRSRSSSIRLHRGGSETGYIQLRCTDRLARSAALEELPPVAAGYPSEPGRCSSTCCRCPRRPRSRASRTRVRRRGAQSVSNY